MLFDWFLIIIGFLWLLAGSVFDIKTREIPDWLNYSLISIGLGIRLIYSLFLWDFTFILYGLLGFGIFFVLAMIMYYGKQWGGGDCKLLMGLGALFGSGPSFISLNYPFLLILLLNILIVGGFYGIIWSLILMLKKWKNFTKEYKKSDKRGLTLILTLSLIVILLFLLFFRDLIWYGFLFAIILSLTMILLFIIRIVEKCCMLKHINVNNLTEGDWVAEDIKINNKIICSIKDLGLTKKQINLLKKHKIKKILIKEGIPFVPAFLLGYILTLIIGSII